MSSTTSLPSSIPAMNLTMLSKAIHERQVSCVEVMQATLARIEALNPAVNAIISRLDSDDCLKLARQADHELAHGVDHGLLHGIPQAPKDLAATKGLRFTQGSPLFANVVPNYDAIIIERARNAGALMIGKTNVPEFGLGSQTYNSVFGATGNAYDTTKTAGGSSGGAAVALALEMLCVADGSDMMGSLRNPAAYNNVVGFRPSFGRVPLGPMKDVFFQQLSTEGPMGRTVADVAALLSIQAGFDARTPLSMAQDPAIFSTPFTRNVKGMKIGWLADMGGHLAMEPEVLETCRSSLTHFETLGCVVEEAAVDFNLDALWNAWINLRGLLVSGNLDALYRDLNKRPLLKPEARWEVENGLQLKTSDIYAAMQVRTGWYLALEKLFRRYDFLVLPSAQIFPFSIETHWPKTVNGRAMDTYHRWMEVVIYATMAGIPAISMPAGFSKKGLPMGIQILGRAQDDRAVLEIAAAFERAAPYGRQSPPLLKGMK